MGDIVESFVIPFLGALQAAISVLLTIFSGVLAAQLGWLSEKSSKEVSQLCVNILLPALLIYNIGSQMEQDSAVRYVPIIIWAIFYNAASVAIGLGLSKLLKLPDWVTPAIAFNNTTALPLLLIQSLDSTGILDSINPSGGDAVARAKSYFLVNAMIGNSLTFALGPKLLNGQNEDAPEPKEPKSDDPINDVLDEEEASTHEANEESSLLPRVVHQPVTRTTYASARTTHDAVKHTPDWLHTLLTFMWQFINPPLIGAAIGIIIGLAPPLHKLFFASPDKGGYFNAWLTSAIDSLGSMFAALQVLVVGVKLSTALVRMKRGESGERAGAVPTLALVVVLGVRFVIWPAVSIPVIWGLVKAGGGLLGKDPLLWFCMMLMPTGPPALKLSALADVNGVDEAEKMTIAKFLTISYCLSPIISFAVVGSLKASQAAV